MPNPNNQREVLRLENISKRFGGLLVLTDVNLTLAEREIVGLIGPNGAGKSTLFNVITSIYQPEGGHIFLKGKRITGYPSHKICRFGLSRTFQLVKVFLSMTALENTLVGAYYGQRLKGKAAIQTALDSLELVELVDKKDEITGKMTLSERRLLEVARALASRPAVTLLDEPMAGLNLSETMKMLQTINRAREERNLAILWVEHKMEAIFRLCDRVVVLDYGQKIADGPPEEIIKNTTVIEAYFGRPLA
jgi:branched-chain amino acid transport system ATP-binding protein